MRPAGRVMGVLYLGWVKVEGVSLLDAMLMVLVVMLRCCGGKGVGWGGASCGREMWWRKEKGAFLSLESDVLIVVGMLLIM